MTKNEKLNINEHFDNEITKWSEKQGDEYVSLVKQISIVCFATLSLLVSFSVSKENNTLLNCLANFSLLLAYLFFGICILIGVRLLFLRIIHLSDIQKSLEEQKQQRLLNKDVNLTSLHQPITKTHIALRYSHMISFLIAICSLVFFGILRVLL